MKKLIIYVSALLLTTACTSETEQDLSNEPKEIQLTAGILRTQVKAPIGQENDGTLTENLTGVQFLQIDGEKETIDWVSATTPFIGTIAKGAEGTISITSEPHPHYPINGSKTNIMGYYPAGTVSAGKISMTITGAEDVLYAPAVSGSKAQEDGVGKMAFVHKLTQFKVVVKKAADISTDINGINVKVKDANSTFDMAVSNGILNNWGTLISTIQPVTNQSTSGNGYTSTGIMLEPGLPTITLSVSAADYTDKDINFTSIDEGTFKAGKSYILTITFGAKDVTGGASIGKWEEGSNPDGGTVTE